MMPSLVSCWMAGWGARGSCPPPNSLVGPWQYPSHRARGQGSKCCWHPFWGTRSQQHLYKLAGQKDGFSNRHPQRVGWGVWQACTPHPPHLPAAPPPLDDAGGVDAQGVLRCCSVLRWAERWVRLSSGHHPRIPRRGKWVGCKHWSGIEMRGGGVPLPPSPVSNDTPGGGGANENF